MNLSRTGKISLREVRRSALVEEFMHVDEETDINRVSEFFSYEHFYVLYCRFFELDADKDSKLSREDLLRYSEHSLSETIVDRCSALSCPIMPCHAIPCSISQSRDMMLYMLLAIL